MTGFGTPASFCNLNAIAVIRAAAHDFAQERNVITALFDRDIVILDALDQIFKHRQFVIMRCKQRACADALFSSATYSTTARAKRSCRHR